MNKKLFIIILLISATFLLHIGCSKNSDLNPLTTDNSSQLGALGFNFRVSTPEVSSGVVIVTRGSKSYQKSITIENNQGSVTFNNLNVGNWHIRVELYDSDGDLIYDGEKNAVVHRNETTVVTIIVQRVAGNLQVNVIVPELLLWNKLGSDYEVQNSEVGVNGVINGSVLYSPCQFGNGAYSSNKNDYITFDEQGEFDPNKFTVEMWFKTDWDMEGLISSDGRCHAFAGWFYNTLNNWNVKVHASETIGIQWNNRINGVYYCFNAGPIYWNANEVHHIAFVQDIDGIEGSTDVIRIYLDGEIVANFDIDDNVEGMPLPRQTYTNGILYALILRDIGIDYPFYGTVDNIKIWNYAKTDFSDRFTE